MDEPPKDYDHHKFMNLGASEKFTLISKNRLFIKQKGFYHPKDFFRKTIAKKGWKELCQPPRLAATMVIREFYANLTSHVVKQVRVRGVLVDFCTSFITWNRLVTKHTIDFNKTLMKFLESSPMAKVSGKPTVRGIQCISRLSIWPISLKCGITSSLPASFRLPMYVK